MMLVLLIPAISAFPLTGGNGIESATVYGTCKYDGGSIGLDLGMTMENPNDYRNELSIVLVDKDDIFYEPYEDSYYQPLATAKPRYMLSFRGLPDDVVIKHIRFDPVTSDPFIIEWSGVPEVSGEKVDVHYYDFRRGYLEGVMNWWFDVKITNTDSTMLQINTGDFAATDQFGTTFIGSDNMHGREDKTVNLLPGESIRFELRLDAVSPLSRPVYLVYEPEYYAEFYGPESLRMDVSAWA